MTAWCNEQTFEIIDDVYITQVFLLSETATACNVPRPTAGSSLNHYTLDARHLICPLPVIRTQDRVAQLKHNDVLEVQCTDPGALSDIPAWCRINGHELISAQERDDQVLVVLKVKTET